ncbi:DUF445 family protein [Granulosicoccus sp. 3-233]|uniref:DUF445 family protein n=1 Tax=Granulosicoccus sp. 3-233 TaxID=3417969 RepID=UPI003D339EF2
MFDKHLTPNLLAAALVLLSFALPAPWQALVLSTGLFALSGALTNWLAVHMLFERVPGLYGSGVITLHFEEFKAGILRMVHEELFSKDKVERLLSAGASAGAATDAGEQASKTQAKAGGLGDAIDLEPMLTAIDLDAAYDQLVATIAESSFGSMLAMVGGEAALQPLREPFKDRMRGFLADAARSPRIQAAIGEQLGKAASSERFVNRLDQLLRARLDEMTPEMVRDIMQRMIREHLGWLVIWGGVFGGLIGLLAGLFGLFS